MYTLLWLVQVSPLLPQSQLLKLQTPLVSLCSVLKFDYSTARVPLYTGFGRLLVPGSLRHPLMM